MGGHIPETKWESATVTTIDERIPEYLQKICKRDPFSGKVVTGGIVTVKDSSWLMSWTVNRQPHFKQQPKDQIVVWVYSLFVDVAGDYVKCVPCMMPYITAFFMPREAGDRPDVVPEGSLNFAFIGQFAETTRDCIFTTEHSVRTGMEAAYQLLGVERGVPEVFNSTYDIRSLLAATSRLRDGDTMQLPGPEVVRRKIVQKLDATEVGELLKDSGLL
jgi:oleate hydratase